MDIETTMQSRYKLEDKIDTEPVGVSLTDGTS